MAIVVDPNLIQDDRAFITDAILDKVEEGPFFKIGEVSKFFFGKSASWIRWRESQGFFVLDGEDIVFKKTKSHNRYYTLADIERMAHALAGTNAINGTMLNNVILLIKVQARIHGYI